MHTTEFLKPPNYMALLVIFVYLIPKDMIDFVKKLPEALVIHYLYFVDLTI